MKYCVAALILILLHFSGMAQKTNRYLSVSGEINFSSAKIISENGDEGGEVLRFAPWFNLQFYNNIDKDNHGYFIGFTVRNIGFIYEQGNEKWKARNYVFGIPIGIKWGDMNGRFVYAGYEFEVPFNYRERYYRNDSRERVFNQWFSDRVNPFTHAAFVGFDFKYGFNLKLKYYFTEMLNKDFNNENIDDPRDLRYSGGAFETVDGKQQEIEARPYLHVNVFYLAVTWNMFRKPYSYFHYEKEKEAEEMY